MDAPKSKKFYMNKAQRYVHTIAARNNYIIASRRFGKSEGIIMPRLLQNVQSMPRSSGGLIGSTYKQVLTRTLPATLFALERLGYREEIHYFVGRKAPKTSGFADPYIMPRSWDYFIHWYNGSVNPIISQDIPYSSNSLTMDYLIGDEAKTLNRDKLINETLPAVSGLPQFKNNPWHTGVMFVTDMPTNKRGLWILKEEQNMDIELLTVLEGMMHKYFRMKLANTGYDTKPILALRNQIDLFRKELTLYQVFNILDNLEIVGERYVADMHRNLTPFVFRTGLLSQQIKTTEGAFYGALDEKKHYYDAVNISKLNKFRSDYGDIDWKGATNHSFSCEDDTDINHSLPLVIASDTNININWLVVGQADYQENRLNTLKSFFVKSPAMLPEVVKKFTEYYSSLPNKSVIFYYDHTFLQGRSGNSTESFYQTISNELTKAGWIVTEQYIGQAPKHDDKHKDIDDALKGRRGLLPMFNLSNNEDLLTGMENTGTRISPNGWGKDKSGEKKEDSYEDPVEHRTDGGDAWDTLFIGCNNFRVSSVHSHLSLSNMFQ